MLFSFFVDFLLFSYLDYIYNKPSLMCFSFCRISEELIEDALTTVAEELEMESLLKQMIDVELKDYSDK